MNFFTQILTIWFSEDVGNCFPSWLQTWKSVRGWPLMSFSESNTSPCSAFILAEVTHHNTWIECQHDYLINVCEQCDVTMTSTPFMWRHSVCAQIPSHWEGHTILLLSHCIFRHFRRPSLVDFNWQFHKWHRAIDGAQVCGCGLPHTPWQLPCAPRACAHHAASCLFAANSQSNWNDGKQLVTQGGGLLFEITRNRQAQKLVV